MQDRLPESAVLPGNADRRSRRDRRTKRISNMRWLFKRGRRSGLRRESDRRNLHLMDYYSPGIFYILVPVLLLSVADALLTLWLLENGAVELNPVMRLFSRHIGADAFMAVKYLLTSIAVMIVGGAALRICPLPPDSVPGFCFTFSPAVLQRWWFGNLSWWCGMCFSACSQLQYWKGSGCVPLLSKSLRLGLGPADLAGFCPDACAHVAFEDRTGTGMRAAAAPT